MAGGAAARHARHHALRRDPPDAVVAAVGHEEHAVRVEHQPARVRERRLDALAVGVAARARPGEHAQAVAVEDADAVVAGVGDVHAPRRRDGEPARVEQRDATTLGCVFVNGLGRRRRRAVEDGDVVRAVHPEVLRRVGGRVSAGAGAFGRNGREWRAGGKHSVVEVCRPWLHQSPKGASVWPGFPRKGGTRGAADTASGASRCLREPGLPRTPSRRPRSPPPLATLLLRVGSPHRPGSQRPKQG